MTARSLRARRRRRRWRRAPAGPMGLYLRGCPTQHAPGTHPLTLAHRRAPRAHAGARRRAHSRLLDKQRACTLVARPRSICAGGRCCVLRTAGTALAQSARAGCGSAAVHNGARSGGRPLRAARGFRPVIRGARSGRRRLLDGADDAAGARAPARAGLV